jgi:natural product precursor
MKELLKKFSEQMLSKQQLQCIKGGTSYCNCNGVLTVNPLSGNGTYPPCSTVCSSPGGPGGGPKPCPYDPKKWC